MNTGSQTFQLAASFDWEGLVPVLFFVLYGIAQFIGSKKKKDAAREDEGAEPEADFAERTRQIREEIRRKIEERQRAQEGGTRQAAPQQGRPVYDPTLPDGQPRPRQPAVARQSAPKPKPIVVHQPEFRGAGDLQSNLEKRLEKQKKVLENTRKQQADAVIRARQIVEAAGARRATLQRTKDQTNLAITKTFRHQLLAELDNPLTVRRAVLYKEILDTPLGLR